MWLKIDTRPVLAMILVVSLILVGARVAIAPSHQSYPSEYRQSVLSSQVIEDQTLLVSEWIVVEDSEELSIINSNIVFIEDEMAIIVQDGGSLTISGSLLYSYPSCSWWISGESGSELLIEQSTLTGSGTKTHAGINIWCDDAVVESCHLSEFGGDNINVGNCNGVRIRNNVVTGSAWEGINFGQVTDLIISGNNVSDTGYCGIFGTGSEDVTITGNTISTTSYSGVCLDHTSVSAVSYNNFSETNQNAIDINYCDKINLNGNTVFSSYGCGILSIWSTNLQIMDNEIHETVYDGVNLLTHSDKISVINNEFYDTYSCAIVSDSSSNIFVFRNYMENIRLSGFEGVGDSENLTAISNTMIDCGGGLTFMDSENIETAGNWINNSIYHDINVENCGNGLIYANAFCSSGIDVGHATTNLFDWDNSTVGNYWEDYVGVDVDHNEIGDSPYVVSYGYVDNYPLMGLDYINNYRSSFNITAYFWIPSDENTSDTSTGSSTNALDNQFETLLIFNSSIQILCVGVILIVLKRIYST